MALRGRTSANSTRRGSLKRASLPHEQLLDLRRVAVLAAGDRHVLLAPDDEVVAIGAALPQIASVPPAAAKRLGGRLRPIPVARADVRAGKRQLAHRALRHVA